LNIPVTSDFVSIFDTDPKDKVVTTNEIARVSAQVTPSELSTLNDVAFEMLNGAIYGTFGTLRVTLTFAPKVNHANDWYTEDLILRTLSVDGANSKTISASTELGSSGVPFSDVKNATTGSSGGCDTGLGFSGLLFLAPFVLRKKK
jgi:Synergist-CTERM protein sorting domain-containing protein